MPKLIEKYRNDNDKDNMTALVYLCAIGMRMFSGYPEIYEPILNEIQVS